MKKKTTEEFIEEAKRIYGEQYDYSRSEYVNDSTKVCIICPKHGEFWQTPYSHLQGCGCPKCSANTPLTRDEYIQKAAIRHSGKYDYSITEFTKTVDKIAIKCPFHGIFYQIAEHHLQGCGCPKCKSSHMESDIRKLLIENDIDFEEQKRFSWLGLQSLDFYLPKQNVAIECQGKQHFEPINFFGGKEGLKAECKRDKLKHSLCSNNGVKLIYYANYKYDFPYEVFTNKNKLLKSIIK